jgi:hypothetical protein
MRDISYLLSYGKHYFDIDEVGESVFQGSLGFRNDIKQYTHKHKPFSIVHYNDKEWISGAVLHKIIRWLQRDGINSQFIIDFVAFLKKEGVKTTRKKWSSMVWKEVGFKQKWCCNACKEILKPTFELDHIVELQDDGADTIDNLQGLCVECHARKTRDRRLQEVVYSFKTSPIKIKTSKYFDEYNFSPKKKIKLEY